MIIFICTNKKCGNQEEMDDTIWFSDNSIPLCMECNSPMVASEEKDEQD